jgi:hypothetical protein
MNGPTDPDNAAGTSSAEQRVSTLVGDRLCIRCGYNLTGQPVVREPRYDMLMARCPECGTVASLQEYPLLGRWAARWAALLAAAWFVVILAGTFANAGMFYGSSMSIAYDAAEPYAVYVAERQLDDLRGAEDQGTLPQTIQWILQNPPSPHTVLDSTWQAQQDFGALLAEAGGWWAIADFSALKGWTWLALMAAAAGSAWSVVLLHMRRRWLVVLGLVPVAIAGIFAAVSRQGVLASMGGWGWTLAFQVAHRQVGLPVVAMTLAFTIIPMSLGLVLGRSIVRGLARALLPPRLRSSLALLWTGDGLAPPAARRSKPRHRA